MIDILFVWYICSLRDQVVGMEVIVGPQDGPSQKLIDELEVRYQTGCTAVTFEYMVYIVGELNVTVDLLGCDAVTWGEEFLVF
jgi:hypothetical protein